MVILEDTLEKDLARIIGFIGNCDSKSSIMLGSTLTAVSLILGLCGKEIIGTLMNSDAWISISTCIVLIISLFMVVAGIANVIMSIRARLDPTEYEDDSSVIFYGKIAALGLPQYRGAALARDRESYLVDLTAQIHTCSIICQKKFEYYNRGLSYSVLGVVLLVLVAGISLFV